MISSSINSLNFDEEEGEEEDDGVEGEDDWIDPHKEFVSLKSIVEEEEEEEEEIMFVGWEDFGAGRERGREMEERNNGTVSVNWDRKFEIEFEIDIGKEGRTIGRRGRGIAVVVASITAVLTGVVVVGGTVVGGTVDTGTVVVVGVIVVGGTVRKERTGIVSTAVGTGTVVAVEFDPKKSHSVPIFLTTLSLKFKSVFSSPNPLSFPESTTELLLKVDEIFPYVPCVRKVSIVSFAISEVWRGKELTKSCSKDCRLFGEIESRI